MGGGSTGKGNAGRDLCSNWASDPRASGPGVPKESSLRLNFPVAGLVLAGLIVTGGAHAAPAAAATPAVTSGAANAPSALKPILSALELGTPLPALPDCADSRTPDGRDVTALCVEHLGDGVMRQVGVPRDKRPGFMDGTHLIAVVDRNSLVGLIVPTDGMRSEQAALQSLTALYGKPFRQEQEAMRDKSGKSVRTVHAGWMKRPLTAELYAIPEDPETGTIELMLPQARDVMAARDVDMVKKLNPEPAAPAVPAKPVKKGTW